MIRGLIVLALFVAANLLAAGVVLGLGLALQAIAPMWISPLPWVAIGAASIAAAVLFLKHAVLAPRVFLVDRVNPNKGLNSAKSRRGG